MTNRESGEQSIFDASPMRSAENAETVHEMLTAQIIEGDISPAAARDIYIRFYTRRSKEEALPVTVEDAKNREGHYQTGNPLEEERIRLALQACLYHLGDTAHVLGIHRKTLSYKLRFYGIERRSKLPR